MKEYLPELAYFLQWNLAVPVLLSYILLPFISFVFYCRYCNAPFRWIQSLCYIMLLACVRIWELATHLQGVPGLLAEMLLLACLGYLLLKRKWTESLAAAVLILAVSGVSNSIAEWIGYRLMLPFILQHERWVYPSDTMIEGLKVLMVCALLTFILAHFRNGIMKADPQTLMQMTLPVFFISLVVRIIQTAVYGNGIQVNRETGEIQSIMNINHAELLLLQILACICLLATLSAYQKIVCILHEKQKLCLLEQQAAVQEIYMKEAILRDRKTRAFRHDIQNHLTVLAELLRTAQTSEALEYLTCLEHISTSLSYPVQTGRAAVDALLGSKLSVAEQKRIQVQCELYLPETEGPGDIEWCILLSNALDNAIKACECVQDGKRKIRITSHKKGMFFLLTIENSCNQELRKVPEDGTGLSNIRSVMKNYHGTAENTVSGGIYRLQLFFGILQQKKDISHQFCDRKNRADDID